MRKAGITQKSHPHKAETISQIRLDEQLAVPFKTRSLAMEVIVERINITDEAEIVAICRRGRERQRISIIDLPLPNPRPVGSEWMDAYRRCKEWR